MFALGLLLIALPIAVTLDLSRTHRRRQVLAGVAGIALGLQVGATYLASQCQVAWEGVVQGAEEAAPSGSPAVPVPSSPPADSAKPDPATATAVVERSELAEKPSASSGTPKADEAKPAHLESTPDSASPLPGLKVRPEVPQVSDIRYLAESRPDWLEAAPSYEGGIVRMAVRAGPYRTARDCEEDLAREVQTALRDFLRDQLRSDLAPSLPSLQYSLTDLRKNKVIRQEFSEQLATRYGVMTQVHAQLVFDSSFQDEVDRKWGDIRSNSRLAQLGLGVGVVLMFLATVFGFLKADTATRGYYTGRLQFGAAATILALVATSVLLAKWIPWM